MPINKTYRELQELKGLFADPKYYRQAWKSVGNAILMNPAAKPIERTDKDGNETDQSKLERYTYEELNRDLKAIQGPDRHVTELEMILACQAQKARTDTGAAVFIRDTLGAKPVDETKVDQTVNNVYEGLSDEELEAIAAMRAKKAAEQAAVPAATPPHLHCNNGGDNLEDQASIEEDD